MIDYINGDYFVDCSFASQPFLRAAFGVWVSIYAAVIAYCVRYVFRSRLTARLLCNNSGNRKVSLWVLSPATTPTEVFELREMLIRALRRGHVSYVTVSLFCLAAALVSAASTSIANHTVVKHLLVRRTDVPGRLAQRDVQALLGLSDRTTERYHALDHAQAPLDQLFDFVPDDDSNWVFVQEEWNNTWLGQCAFHMYPAVDLVVQARDLQQTNYQDLLPGLGTVLPPWATLDDTKQSMGALWSPQTSETNLTGSWRDALLTFAFGSAPFAGNESLPTTNISFANILLHNIGKGNESIFMTTAFKSDVHVVECTFNNTSFSEDQARADDGQYYNAVVALANWYGTAAGEASFRELAVVQPTAQQMMRYWQAYKMVQHGLYIHPVNRKLSVFMEVVQIRLSVVVITIVTFVLALTTVVVSRFAEPLDEHGKRLTLPSSQLHWIVEAARQHHREGQQKSHVGYAKEREDLYCAVLTEEEGLSRTQIISIREKPIEQSFLCSFDPHSIHDNPVKLSSTSTKGDLNKNVTQPFFDPYAMYHNSEAVLTTSNPGAGGKTALRSCINSNGYSLYEGASATATPGHG